MTASKLLLLPVLTAGWLMLSGCGARSYELKLAFPRDQQLNYQLSGWQQDPTDYGVGYQIQDTKLTKAGTIVIQEVDEHDGVATVRSTVRSLKFGLDGRAAGTQPDTTTEIRIAWDGQIDSGHVFTPLSPDPTIGLLFPLLPHRNVRIGETWAHDYQIPTPTGRGTQQVSTTNTLTKVEEANGRMLATIDSQINISTDIDVDLREQAARTKEPLRVPPEFSPRQHIASALNGTQTATFDLAQHRLVSSNGTYDMAVDFINSGFPPGVLATDRITGQLNHRVELTDAKL